MLLAAAMLPLGTAPVEVTENVKAQKPSKSVSNDAAQDLRSTKGKVDKNEKRSGKSVKSHHSSTKVARGRWCTPRREARGCGYWQSSLAQLSASRFS